MIAVRANVERAREVQTADTNTAKRASARLRGSVTCPKGKCKLTDCWFGKAYGLSDSTNVEIKFDDIIQVNVYAFANENSYMFVGTQLRKYRVGIPMGDPLSCAKANGTCLHAEMTCDNNREKRVGDSERNLTLCFMDDLFIKVAYDAEEHDGEQWTEASAEDFKEELKKCYPKRLVLE